MVLSKYCCDSGAVYVPCYRWHIFWWHFGGRYEIFHRLDRRWWVGRGWFEQRHHTYIFIRTGMPISCVLDVDRGVRHSYWPISFVHCALADNLFRPFRAKANSLLFFRRPAILKLKWLIGSLPWDFRSDSEAAACRTTYWRGSAMTSVIRITYCFAESEHKTSSQHLCSPQDRIVGSMECR